MFRDLNGYYSRPEKPEPPRGLTTRQGTFLILILGLNIVGLIIAPIGGVSIVEFLFR